jgi:hypothetical protein
MAPTKSKPSHIKGAHNIADMVQDQILASNRIVPLVLSGPHKTLPPDQSHNLDINTNEIRYVVLNHGVSSRGALVDRGANGGILGQDARVICKHIRMVDVTGIDNHEMSYLPIVDGAAWVMTNNGPIIAIFKQYAYHGINRTIHSSLQLEYYKNRVDDKSVKAGGQQCITTLEGQT